MNENVLNYVKELRELYRYGPLGGTDIYITEQQTYANKFHICSRMLDAIITEDIFETAKYLKYLIDEQSSQEDEIKLISTIKEILTDVLYIDLEKINKIRNLRQFKVTSAKFRHLTDQKQFFERFYENQNNFDNAISLLKIAIRYNSYHRTKMEINFEFNNEYTEDDFMNILDNIIEENTTKEFNSIRFMI